MREGGYQKVGGYLEFMERFPNEEACRDFLFSRRWPSGFVCPRCGERGYSHVRTRDLYQCSSCRYQASVTAGTVMEGTRTPLILWFWLIFLMAREKTGVSVYSFCRMAGIRYQTAWLMSHKIRCAMASRDALYRLAGLVELDDSYFGATRAGKRGRGAEGRRPVLVGVSVNQKGPAHAVMRVVGSVSASEIKGEAKKSVQEGSRIITDGFTSYPAALSSYEHQGVILGSLEEAGKKLPWVHILVANAKGIIRGVHHGVSGKHLQAYLSEFCYRFSRRFWEGELFDRLLWACITDQALTYSQLVA